MREGYNWEIYDPIRRNPNTDKEEIIQRFHCEPFFKAEKLHTSTIVKDSLLEVEAMREEKKKWGKEKPLGRAKTSSVPTSCAGCQELERNNARRDQIIAELQQSNIRQDQINAALHDHVQALNFYVLPMQKIHRRVLLHNLRAKICSILSQDLKLISSWYDYLGSILASPKTLETLHMDAEIIQFVRTEEKVAKLNDAAHEAEQQQIALAVLAVRDPATRPKWERVFVVVYGVEPTFEEE